MRTTRTSDVTRRQASNTPRPTWVCVQLTVVLVLSLGGGLTTDRPLGLSATV